MGAKVRVLDPNREHFERHPSPSCLFGNAYAEDWGETSTQRERWIHEADLPCPPSEALLEIINVIFRSLKPRCHEAYQTPSRNLASIDRKLRICCLFSGVKVEHIFEHSQIFFGA